MLGKLKNQMDSIEKYENTLQIIVEFKFNCPMT